MTRLSKLHEELRARPWAVSDALATSSRHSCAATSRSEVEAMTRDGRWQRLLDEANGVRQAVTPAVPFPQPSTHTPVRPRALPELRLACQDESRKIFKGPRRMDPDLYKRMVERRQLYVRNCIDSEPQDVELTGSSTSTTIALPPRRPVGRL